MIGPAIQSVLFISVIYWYTKGMMSLINDYYRDEFKSHIEKDAKSALPTKPTQLAPDPDTCPAVHADGLPNALESNSIGTKPNGIVHRRTDKIHSNNIVKQCTPPPQANTVESWKDQSKLVSSYITTTSKSIEPTTLVHSVPSKAESHESTTYAQSILNPSKIGQSNYRQMANQQTSDTTDGKTTIRTSSNRYDGNYFANDGGTADVVARQLTGKSTSFIKASTSEPAMTQKGHTVFSSTPKIALNGVLLSADLVRQRLDETLNKETCPRKSVNEMVQYWTNYLETVETNEHQTSCQGRKTPTMNGNVRMKPRARSSDEICIRTRSFRSTPDG